MKILKIFGLLVLAALILAFVVPTQDYEKLVADVETRRLQESGQCPLSEEELLASTPEAVVLCVNYGLTAYQDAEQHPPSAERVYGLLGQTAELHEVRQVYGSKVIAVIDSYYTRGSSAAQLSNTVGAVVNDLWGQLREDPMAIPALTVPDGLTPEELAAYALVNIKEHREIFLVQFEIQEDGSVVRKPIESFAQNVYSVLMGGVRNLERKVILGQELTAYDYGGAALDVAVVFAGVKLLTKPVAAAGKAGKLATYTSRAMKALTVGTKVGVVGAVGVGTYVAITDPWRFATGLSSAGGWIAEQVGAPIWLGKAAGWFVLLIILWPIVWVIYRLIRFANRLVPYRLILRPKQRTI